MDINRRGKREEIGGRSKNGQKIQAMDSKGVRLNDRSRISSLRLLHVFADYVHCTSSYVPELERILRPMPPDWVHCRSI